ncbi:MAG TPA: NAD(P)/FAD-dependent oxidoreductase [Chitinophagaceae bacterium]|nr:NAD(P)/FAD-dependent oxidoreductase [Chitinophagaceae bacterium]
MDDNKIYDVAIAGGGLAGLTLAIQCAGAGCSVLLIEKEQYPFHKVCGEYISMESYAFLQRIGLPLGAWDLPVIDTLQTSDIKGNVYNFSLPLGGFGISRYKMDNALYKLAVEKGVNVITQTRVTAILFANGQFAVETGAGCFVARCAVGSFGKRSNLDVKWQRSFVTSKPSRLNNYVGVKYHVRYPQQKNVIALHNFHNGYCGISNIEDGLCCLCYLTTAENLRRGGNNIRQMEKDILMQNPHLRKIFSEADFVYKEPLTIAQVSFAKKSIVHDHVLMVGDAAGMIAPLCGNGMSMAMHAGKLAFENINDFLQGRIDRDTMEKQYLAQWQQLFTKRMFTGRFVQRVFGNNTATALFLKFAHKNAWLAKKLISSTHGTSF